MWELFNSIPNSWKLHKWKPFPPICKMYIKPSCERKCAPQACDMQNNYWILANPYNQATSVCREGGLGGKFVYFAQHNFCQLPGKVYSLLCELTISTHIVMATLVYHYLHAVPAPFALLRTVACNHIQLTNPVLQPKCQKLKSIIGINSPPPQWEACILDIPSTASFTPCH